MAKKPYRDARQISPDYAKVITGVAQELDPREIQHMDAESLLKIQSALGFGSGWGVWTVPEKWMPNSRPSDRSARLRDGSPTGDQEWLHVLRVVLVSTLTVGASGWLMSPATVLTYAKRLTKVSRHCGEALGSEEIWWGRIDSVTCHQILKKGTRNILSQFGHLYAGGFVCDQPRSRPMDLGAGERDRFGDPEISFDPRDKKTWQPLPDQFTSECGRRCLWFVTVLGPQILNCYETCGELSKAGRSLKRCRSLTGLSPESKRLVIGQLRNEIVRDWDWHAPTDGPLASLPFDVHLLTRVNEPQKAKREGLPIFEPFTWPPRTWGDLVALTATLQTCHAWLFLLASGPRSSTVISYTVDSLKAGLDGPRVEGLLMKRANSWGGKRRDWPVPKRLVMAFEQQVRLATAVKSVAQPGNSKALGPHLWVQVGKGGRGQIGSPLYNFNASLDVLVDVFGLRSLLGTEFPRLHTHRFRKTLARVIALALTSAQMVLMDTLGHDDPDVTLGYMLSDKTVVSDALQVQKELVIIMAVDAFNNAESVGGPVGERIRESRNRYLRMTGKSRLDPKDAYELVDRETFGGRSWRQVMPGVICTISQFDSGPCGEGKGVRTDPTNCQAGCRHQLLQAEHLNRCDENIAEMLRLLQRSSEEENEMLTAALAPQIANELYRWEVTYEKWRDHPLIQKFCDLTRRPHWQEGGGAP